MENLDKFHQWTRENNINPYEIVVDLIQQAMERNINLDKFLDDPDMDRNSEYYRYVYDPSVLSCICQKDSFETLAFGSDTFCKVDPNVLFAEQWDLEGVAENYMNKTS